MVDQIESPDTNPYINVQQDFNKGTHNEERIMSPINSIGEIEYSYAKEWNWVPVLHKN